MEQILHVNPIVEERKPTNTPFIIVLGIVFLTWLGVGIKALADSSPVEAEIVKVIVEKVEAVERNGDETADNDVSGLSIIEEMTLKFTWSYVVCIIISGLIAIFYVYFLSLSKSKFITEGALYLLIVWMICILVFNSVLSSSFLDNIVVHLGFTFSIPYAIYIIVSFRSARNVGTKEIFEIIKNSCRALSGCYAIPLFLCAVSIILALIASSTVYICYSMLSTANFSNVRAVITYTLINVVCGWTLINFFVNFIHIIISGYVIDWYWMKDQQLRSITLIKRSVMTTLRYHLGTVAFSSIPLLSYIGSIFQACRPGNSDNDVTKIYGVITRFCSQLCTFLYIADFALIQTFVFGYDYTTAIAAAHDLVAQNNHELNIAVSEVSLMVARIGYILIVIPFAYDRMRSAMYSIIIPFSIVFTSAVQALLVNKMIIEKASETLQKGRDCALTEIPKAESPEPKAQPCVY